MGAVIDAVGGAATVYETDVVAVCPPVLVAVTVYVCAPGVEVFSVPCGPDAPFESRHDARPGPPAPSVHENAVATDCPWAKVRLSAGAVIAAEGGSATLFAALCEADPARLVA